MGMFDTVVIENLKLQTSAEIKKFLKDNNASLPSEFQTKDLDCSLRTYKIDSKGQIWAHIPKKTGKKIPYKTPFDGWKDNRSFLERLYFKIILKSYGKAPRYVTEHVHVWQKQKLTNTFEIYTYEEISGRYVELGYDVKAVNGRVKSITPKTSNIESSSAAAKRKKDNQEWEIKMKQSFDNRNAFVSKWYYPFIKETYNPFVFFSKKAIQAICNYIVKLTYRWNGV